MLSRDILDKAHEEALLPYGFGHYHRNVFTAQCGNRFKAPLPANQVIASAVFAWFPSKHCDWLLQADSANVVHDHLKCHLVPGSGVDDSDQGNRNALDVLRFHNVSFTMVLRTRRFRNDVSS